MKWISFSKNKYLYTIIAFLVWIIFFDSNNMIYQWRLTTKLKQLEKQEEFYISEYKKDSAAIYHLSSNMDNLEKFAREHYLMKRNNEDIYLIVRE